MIIIIRISGLVKLPKTVQETLFRLRLRRKYSAVLMKHSPENLKILQKVRNYIAYGNISEETLKELIEKRASPKSTSKKINADEIIEQIEKKDKRSWDIKPFFRLHPPRGGIDSKKHFGVTKKAALGNHKDKIDALVRRML
jgi:large subunit ribosomal protein L30